MSTPFYRINQQIQSPQVRLLREDGTQIGVVTKEEALSQSRTAGVDLVEIAPLAMPPVAKLIDYKKFKYQLAKKEAVAKASSKKVGLKEIRLTPFMADNDFQVKLSRGKKFLAEGHKLRVSVKFMGRQLAHREFGQQLVNRVLAALDGVAATDQTAKWIGRQYITVLTPAKHGKTENSKINS